MIKADNTYLDMINATARYIAAKVEFNGSTYANNGALQSFSIERIANSNKLYGYGICQKLEVKLIDKDRAIEIVKGDTANVVFEDLYTCPTFYVDEALRDENNNNLTITAYDAIHKAADRTLKELTFPTSFTIGEFAEICAAALGVGIKFESQTTMFNVVYEGTANIEGTETIREALDDIAEATGTIYFINNENKLVFKNLDIDGEPVLHIDKTKYFTLTSGEPITLTSVVKATALEDNVEVGEDGVKQYLRDNIFLDLRDDIADLLNNILAEVQNLTINQFTCKWRQNYLLEIGDKISIEAKDGSVFNTYVLDDTLTYNGGMVGTTQWEYSEQPQSAENPATIGDALKYTFAKVDKVNKEIQLVVKDIEGIPQEMSSIKLTTEGIVSSVQKLEQDNSTQNDKITDLEENVKSFSTELEQTAEQIKVEIKQEINTPDSITTSTGFTFNETGLTVEKTGSEMKTLISEDGMTIYRDNTEVLAADNTGVYATNLRATTYLVIGENSRFEDYDNNKRTGCFWIGGVRVGAGV
jgi:uncharacterized protein YoxC